MFDDFCWMGIVFEGLKKLWYGIDDGQETLSLLR